MSPKLGITDHCSYHGVISSDEAKNLLLLAPEKGYITRYSDKKEKFVLSIVYPSSEGNQQICHLLLAIDNEVPSYAMKGSGKSFQSVEEMLVYYETNPVNQRLSNIGISYSQMNTTIWQRERESKKKQQAAELEKKKTQEDEIEVPKKQQSSLTLQQTIDILKKELVEPLTEQQKVYQDQILELQKANKELMDDLERRRSNHFKCNLQ